MRGILRRIGDARLWSVTFLCLALRFAAAQTSAPYTDWHDFGGDTGTLLGVTWTDGSYILGEVSFDAAGNMYGTANGGGLHGPYSQYAPHYGSDVFCGMVWELTSAGTYIDLHDFGGTVTNANGTSGADGWGPTSPVSFDSKGNRYGTASRGGPFGSEMLAGFAVKSGIVWEISAAGAYVDVHDFGGSVTNADGISGPDGYFPYSGVSFDKAGNMYGTTERGGANGGGVVWEITTSGVYRDLHDFGGKVTNANGIPGADGSDAMGPTLDIYGNMFGTTLTGGANGSGIVWELTASGTYKDLHDFGGTVVTSNGMPGADGTAPSGTVTLDGSGSLYGTAEQGGPNPGQSLQANVAYFSTEGMAWEITASGVYKDLHDFGAAVTNANGKTGSDGFTPNGQVAVDKAGNVYGTTRYGGPLDILPPFGFGFNPGSGILWKITPTGAYTDLHDFGGSVVNASFVTGSDGSNSQAGVSMDSLGNLYGASTGSYDNDVPGGCVAWELGIGTNSPSIASFGFTTSLTRSLKPGTAYVLLHQALTQNTQIDITYGPTGKTPPSTYFSHYTSSVLVPAGSRISAAITVTAKKVSQPVTVVVTATIHGTTNSATSTIRINP